MNNQSLVETTICSLCDGREYTFVESSFTGDRFAVACICTYPEELLELVEDKIDD